jgi:hypothetical protein
VSWPRDARRPLALTLAAVALVLIVLDRWDTAFIGTEVNDGTWYVAQSNAPILSLEFLAQGTALFLLTLRVVGDGAALFTLQVVTSAAAWAYLAYELALSMRQRWWGWVVAALVVLVGRAADLQLWNHVALSDSLALSLSVALVAVAIRALREPSTWSRRLLLATALLWGLARPPNILILGFVGLVLAVLLWRRPALRPDWRAFTATLLAVPALMVVLFALASAETSNKGTIYNIIPMWVMTDPDMRTYFEDAGMPVPPELEARAGQPGWGIEQSVGEKGGRRIDSPAWDAHRAWVNDQGMTTYARWVLTHPGWVAERYGDAQSDLWDGEFPFADLLRRPDGEAAQVLEVAGHRSPPLLAVGDVVYLPGRVPLWPLALAALAATAFLARRACPPAWVWLLGLVLVLTPALLLGILLADSQDVSRHALAANVPFRLALLALLAWIVDTLLTVGRRTTAPAASRGRAPDEPAGRAAPAGSAARAESAGPTETPTPLPDPDFVT